MDGGGGEDDGRGHVRRQQIKIGNWETLHKHRKTTAWPSRKDATQNRKQLQLLLAGWAGGGGGRGLPCFGLRSLNDGIKWKLLGEAHVIHFAFPHVETPATGGDEVDRFFSLALPLPVLHYVGVCWFWGEDGIRSIRHSVRRKTVTG